MKKTYKQFGPILSVILEAACPRSLSLVDSKITYKIIKILKMKFYKYLIPLPTK